MDLEAVRVRDCTCSGTPHDGRDGHDDGDLVYLLPTLGLEGGAAAELDLDAVQGLGEKRATNALLARWTVTFVRYGCVGWNWLRDVEGRLEPVPFDSEVLVNDYTLARAVAAKANELYSEAVTRPLLEAAGTPPPNRAQRRSQRGRTGSSTSRPRGSRSKTPRSSSPVASGGPQLQTVP